MYIYENIVSSCPWQIILRMPHEDPPMDVARGILVVEYIDFV